MQQYRFAIGLMSGTSLDGLDLAFCQFTENQGVYRYEVVAAEEVSYSDELRSRLGRAHQLSGFELMRLDQEFAQFCAQEVNRLIGKVGITPDFIASHGHTVFHAPELGFTTQIGNGGTLAGLTGIPVVCDFRSLDVALGGQGAPLVPIGDRLLFSEYDACLNLGGIANISFEDGAKRVAYDISLCNIPLNHYARQMGYPFDREGAIAEKGRIVSPLIIQLQKLKYYKKPYPKSLGREWFEQVFLPILEETGASPEDLMATITEHIASVIGANLPDQGKVLVTGGGAFNSFLMKRIAAHTQSEICLPDEQTIKFKEAIVFAFLGYLRWRQEDNTLASVTGATQDSAGGAIYWISKK
ncbi:MAG TPA: anhydro-N-acetylmuramic acid kinase [Bacteroidales bacterium]|nr:anhydro-N-acetylmuramic acid kinase [Bacteroidales bacterium]